MSGSSGIERSEGQWAGPRTGHAGWYRVWQPAGAARHHLVILHGFGEHSGRYDALAARLAAEGVRVSAPDLWGHGRSGGRRGDIEQFDHHLDDVESALRHSSMTAAPRLHLFGHSFGGLLAAHLGRRMPQQWASLMLQAPLLKLGFSVPWWKARLGRMMAPVWPTLALSDAVDPAWLSRDPEVGRRYMADPLVHHRITVRSYAAITRAADAARDMASSLTVPTLLLYGTGDRVVSPAACADFFNGLTCEKHVVVFRDAYHELHNEPEVESVVSHVLSWMNAHA